MHVISRRARFNRRPNIRWLAAAAATMRRSLVAWSLINADKTDITLFRGITVLRVGPSGGGGGSGMREIAEGGGQEGRPSSSRLDRKRS